MVIINIAREELINGKMKGTNIILPLNVDDDYDTLMLNYITPFNDEGYNITKFLSYEVNDNMCWNIGREFAIGRIINNSIVVFIINT